MQGDCNHLSRVRLQHYDWAVNSYEPLSLAAVRQKLLRDQRVKLGSRPTRFHEQRMDLCECVNAPFDQFLEVVSRTGMGKTHRRLHGGQDVLCAVFGLAREIDNLRLAPFALRYVASDFRCADDFSLSVPDRRNGQRNVDQTPMLALPNGFIVFDALAAPDSLNDPFFLLLVIGWDQNRNRLADDFLGQIAENALRAGIPTRYDAIEVLGDDCIVA
jgi:hypothetical protein